MKQQSTCIMYTIITGMYEKASTEKPQFIIIFFFNKGPVEKCYCNEQVGSLYLRSTDNQSGALLS